MVWTKEDVVAKLQLIKDKGFIAVPQDMYRIDDGIVGQILEREFGVAENNLHIADLGTYELKGMRKRKNRSNNLTLFHQTSSAGLTPLQIFDRFGYERKSNRSDEIKKKLFTTIGGKKYNSLNFILKANGDSAIDLYYRDEYLSTWDLSTSLAKINQVLLVFAETEGTHNTVDEKFHYTDAYILSDPKNIYEAILSGAVVMDLCIDQPIGNTKGPHDRGPHIRIPIKKLSVLFDSVEKIL